MSRPLRRLGYTAGTVAAIFLVAAAAVWLSSERILHRRRDVPVAHIPVLDDLIRLARTAAPREPKTLDMMAAVARDRLLHMRDSELADLHAYLQSLPADAPATAAR